MTLQKLLKKLTETVATEMRAMTASELERCLADSERAIAKATKERNENPNYQAAKQAVKDLSEGLRELRSYQNAKIEYALRLLDGDSSEE